MWFFFTALHCSARQIVQCLHVQFATYHIHFSEANPTYPALLFAWVSISPEKSIRCVTCDKPLPPEMLQNLSPTASAFPSQMVVHSWGQRADFIFLTKAGVSKQVCHSRMPFLICVSLPTRLPVLLTVFPMFSPRSLRASASFGTHEKGTK